MFNMHPGQQYDRFLMAAMVSRAKIEQAWSGGNNDDAEAANAGPKEEPQAFDPAMLKKLAERAEQGDIQEKVAPAVVRSLSASAADLTGFSAEVIAAGNEFKARMKAPVAAGGDVDDDEDSCVPLAFRPRKPKAPGAQGGGSSVVPLAFLKMKKAASPKVPTSGTEGAQSSASSVNGDLKALENGDEESLKRDFQEKLQQTQKMFQEAQAQVEGVPVDKGIHPEGKGPENDAKNTEAVSSIVSLTLQKAQAAAEATRTFHSVAPEAKPTDSREARKRSKWDEDGRPMRVDTSDPAMAERLKDSSQSGDKTSEANSVPTLRELSALARGETSSDAPALGELRAPTSTDQKWVDPHANAKTGAQVAREQRNRALGHGRSRSRSRRRPRRRSPSSSPEKKGKRLFTDKPTFRMTGSSFSAASTKTDTKEANSKKFSELKKDDLPDWLKDMAEPAAAPAMIQLGKKYLHMPRIMVEVLTHNGGEAIRTCMEKSGAQIRVETTIEEPIGIVSVNGPVILGEQCIREVLAGKGLDLPAQDGLIMPFNPQSTNQESGNNMQDIQIPSELVRHFVGHRGCNLKAITQKLGHSVSIQILPSILPGGFQRIQISGSNRKEARTLVIQHIEELKRQKLTLWGDTHNRDRHNHQHSMPAAPPPPPPPIPIVQGGVSI